VEAYNNNREQMPGEIIYDCELKKWNKNNDLEIFRQVNALHQPTNEGHSA